MHTLKIVDLKVRIQDRIILDKFNLEIKEGEIHAIMGPNGAGKSTLSKVIMGYPDYVIEEGSIYFDDLLINDMPVNKRANLGIFLGMQNPIEIEGVTNADFLRNAVHTKDGANFNLMKFIKKINKECDNLKIPKEMIHRFLNVGFSGGERKKNEILQLKLLKPNTVLLDEIDSGLDVDSLKVVCQNIIDYYNEQKPSIIMVTHYKRLLEYIKPDFVHILIDGKIVKTSDYSLVKIVEEKGYDYIKNMEENTQGKIDNE